MPPPLTPLQEQKQRLRDEMRALRLAASGKNKNAAQALADVFNRAVQPEAGAVIAAYRAFRNEIDPSLIVATLRAGGHKITLPVILGERMPLEFRLFESGDKLVTNAMGIQQPAASSPLVEPDILLVPLLAFDKKRNRLGYGGGYYDRTIADLRTRKRIIAIGIAYSWQEVSVVPAGPNDAGLDKILTEVNFF